jgi:hypothetical protein
LISWGKDLRSVDLGTVEEGSVSGPQVPKYPVAVFTSDFGMATASAFVGDWDFVGGSPSDDEGLVIFQAKNIRPTVSLADN